MEYLDNIGKSAKEASKIIRNLSTEKRNEIIVKAAHAIGNKSKRIITANCRDVKKARQKGLSDALIDRLTLTESRINDIAEGLLQVAGLPDPLGDFVQMKTLPNGLIIGQKRVAMGVIAIIYEARPNVTVDAFGLCIKAGSSVILRGGSEAIHSNKAIVSIFQKVLADLGLPIFAVSLIEDTSRRTAIELMQLNKYLDVLIPRGSEELIKTVVENSTVPVIETGSGNCHIYVDKWADLEKAVQIIVNAKTQRPAVCNACETVVLHKDIAKAILPQLCKELKEKNVEIRGDVNVFILTKEAVPAFESDWETEYLDNIIAIRIVDDMEKAIAHIDRYSTGHSEAIITENYTNSQIFLERVDSAVVYVNSSTRFTDGYEFGFGAEIGISTQKLHARGPMGLKELTTTKYVVYGSGQIRK